jgi:hypothetical protein
MLARQPESHILNLGNMKKTDPSVFWAVRAWLHPIVFLTLATSMQARAWAEDAWDWSKQSVLPSNLDALLATSGPVDTQPRPTQVRLFGMTSPFLGDPVGLDQDDFNPANPGVPLRTPGPSEQDGGPDWINVTIGNDNPFFELRRAGDPGGVGYYRMSSQIQVIDSPDTMCTIGMQAFTPAGLAQAGVGSGPTSVCPSVAICQQIGDGAVIYGYLGENLIADPRAISTQLRQRLTYGVAVHQPLFPELPDRTENIYLFVQALGRVHYDTATVTSSTAPSAVFQVLPGLQWKASENMWWSSGVVVPLTPSSRPGDASHLQITCSFQF